MEILHNWRNRNIDIDHVFQYKDDKNMNGEYMINELSKLLNKEMKIWWDMVTLEKYLEKELIPQGLLINKEPSFTSTDPTFAERWNFILKRTSFDLMSLIILDHKSQLEKIENEIVSIQEKLEPIKNIPEYKEQAKHIQQILAKNEKEIIDRKRSKFWRDKNRPKKKLIEKERNFVNQDNYRRPWNNQYPYNNRTPNFTTHNYNNFKKKNTYDYRQHHKTNKSPPRYYHREINQYDRDFPDKRNRDKEKRTYRELEEENPLETPHKKRKTFGTGNEERGEGRNLVDIQPIDRRKMWIPF